MGPASENFRDDQVLGLALVETDHQAAVATAALSRGLAYPEVQAYAQRLVDEMGPARDRLEALGAARGLTPDTSTVEAASNLGDTRDDSALLQPVSGVDVDRIYLPDSVHDLQKAIEIWDNTLVPSVSDAALAGELKVDRALLVDELAAGTAVLQETGLPPK